MAPRPLPTSSQDSAALQHKAAMAGVRKTLCLSAPHAISLSACVLTWLLSGSVASLRVFPRLPLSLLQLFLFSPGLPSGVLFFVVSLLLFSVSLGFVYGFVSCLVVVVLWCCGRVHGWKSESLALGFSLRRLVSPCYFLSFLVFLS